MDFTAWTCHTVKMSLRGHHQTFAVQGCLCWDIAVRTSLRGDVCGDPRRALSSCDVVFLFSSTNVFVLWMKKLLQKILLHVLVVRISKSSMGAGADFPSCTTVISSSSLCAMMRTGLNVSWPPSVKSLLITVTDEKGHTATISASCSSFICSADFLCACSPQGK